MRTGLDADHNEAVRSSGNGELANPCDANGAAPVVFGAVVDAGDRLEQRRRDDRSWRTTRQAELQARVNRARVLEARGMRIGTFAITWLVPSLIVAIIGAVLLIGTPFVYLALSLPVGTLLALPIACVLLFTGRLRRAYLAGEARRAAIEVDLKDSAD